MPTPEAAPLALLVVGVGRSGTSLAMQALEQLGVMGPADPVPADENNLRGTGEDTALRDQFVSLRRALGPTQGLLPPSWKAHPAAQEAGAWLRDYLAGNAARCEGPAFAMKFPAASVFLPLWQEAAEAQGLRLRVIWATRNASDICRSRSRAYASSLTSSVLFHADRSFYILRDAPADSLLFPYEGWRVDPAAQVAALAEAAEVVDPDRVARAREAFAPHLDHGGAGEPMELPPAIRALDDALVGRLARLGDLFPEGSTVRLSLLTGLADLIAELTREQPGALTRSDDGIEARIGLLRALSATNSDETRMKNELDVLTQRIRDVSAENRKLRADQSEREQSGRKPEAAARGEGPKSEAETDTAELKRNLASLSKAQARSEEALAAQKQAVAALTAEKQKIEAEVAELRQGHASLSKANAQLEEKLASLAEEKEKLLAEASERRRAYAALTKAHDRLEEEIASRFHLRLSLADTNGKKLAEERDRLKRQVAALEDRFRKAEAQKLDLLRSTSWKVTAPLRKATTLLRRTRRPG